MGFPLKLVTVAAKVFGAWLVLLVVSWVAPAALGSGSWVDLLKVALAVQVIAAVALWLLDVVRFAAITFAVRALARVAIRFAVPAVGLEPLAQALSGVDVAARWPGYLLGGLSAAWPLFRDVTLFRTRPRHGASCAIQVGDETLIALGDWGHRVGLFEPTTEVYRGVLGRTARVLPASGMVTTLCQLTAGDRPLLAVGSDDRVVRLWDPATGQRVHVLTGHRGAVHAMCPVEVDGATLLATGGDDATIRLWDPVTGAKAATLGRHPGIIRGLCQVTVDGTTLLASVGAGGGVWLWDPRTRQRVRALPGPRSLLQAVCTVRIGDRVLVAAAGQDGHVHVWDAVTGEHLHALAGTGHPMYGLCHVHFGDRHLLASAGDGVGVPLRDPLSGERLGVLGDDPAALANHSGWFRTVCETRVGDTLVIVAAGYNEIAEVWAVDEDTIAATIREGLPGDAA